MKSLSHVRLFATPWTVAYQAPLSMEFSRQEYWSGLPFPSPGYLPDPGIEPGSPTLQADALPSEPPGKPIDGVFVPSAVLSAAAVGVSSSELRCSRGVWTRREPVDFPRRGASFLFVCEVQILGFFQNTCFHKVDAPSLGGEKSGGIYVAQTWVNSGPPWERTNTFIPYLSLALSCLTKIFLFWYQARNYD